MESLTTLLFKVSEHVAYTTLNRPTAVNAVSLDLAEELEEVARECDESSVRAVLLTSAGRIFCGGGDLKSFAAQEPTHLPTHLKRVNLFFNSAIQCFARMLAPVVVAVNGPAAGYGMSLACAGDIVLANESARFTIAYNASRLNARRIFNLLLATNHRTPPYNGTGVDESNFDSARSRSDWSSHAGSAR